MFHRKEARAILFYLSLGCGACTNPAAPIDPAETGRVPGDIAAVTSAAERDYKTFLHRIPQGDEAAYGFKNRSEFEHVRIGTPLRVHTIDVDRSGPSPTVSEHIRPLNEWRVPLIVEDTPRALLTVAESAAGINAVDFGASGLAAALHSLQATVPAETGSTSYLLRLFDLRQDFLSVQGAAGDRFYPASPGTIRGSPTLSNTAASVPEALPAEQYYDLAGLMSLIRNRIKDGAP